MILLLQTVDADAKTETVCHPACGSSFFSAAAADAAEAHSAAMDAEMTAVCGSSFSLSAAADSVETHSAAMDADAKLFCSLTGNREKRAVSDPHALFFNKPFLSAVSPAALTLLFCSYILRFCFFLHPLSAF